VKYFIITTSISLLQKATGVYTVKLKLLKHPSWLYLKM